MKWLPDWSVRLQSLSKKDTDNADFRRIRRESLMLYPSQSSRKSDLKPDFRPVLSVSFLLTDWQSSLRQPCIRFTPSLRLVHPHNSRFPQRSSFLSLSQWITLYPLPAKSHRTLLGAAGNVGSGSGMAGRMRRFKRKGRRILAGAVGLRGRSRSSATIQQTYGTVQ